MTKIFLPSVLLRLLGSLIRIICLLVAIAYYTVAERKIMAAIQRRRGPNVVGIWGLLQPLADGLKLVAKEMVLPNHSVEKSFVLAPMAILALSLMNWAVIPFNLTDEFEQGSVSAYQVAVDLYDPTVGEGFSEVLDALWKAADIKYGIFYLLALSSLSVYGIIIAGWSSNSKYAFLGALRSAAQMVSYEITISLIILPVILLAGSLNISEIIESQTETVWYVFPLFPLMLIFIVAMLAETNRTPFDLAEAEAELVAGYNVEYSSITFAMFFLAEYGSMILMSVLCVILFFGGNISLVSAPIWLAVKSLIFWFFFVQVRATVPRYRYDQLMDIGWKLFLPFTTGALLLSLAIYLFIVQDGWEGAVESTRIALEEASANK